MKISKTMLIQILTIAVGVLTLPALGAVVGDTAMPIMLAATFVLTLIANWLTNQSSAITAFSVLGLVAQILAEPHLFAVVPVQYAQYVALAAAILNAVTRANIAQPALKTVVGVPLLKTGW